MQVLCSCPSCLRTVREEVGPATTQLKCSHCAWVRPVDEADRVAPTKCVLCGCDDLWRQKDFPQKLGVAMVALGALLSTIAIAYYLPIVAISILLGFAALDMILYAVMRDVLVCYRCQARYRNVPGMEERAHFNLETAERYRQEAARMQPGKPA